jgi:GTP-binding protein EngB required for normal cell division
VKERDLIGWFNESAKPFLQKHAPTRLAALQNDYDRLQRLHGLPDQVTVCFLGNSGIGKSTLLNALAAGPDHVLPAGGIGPLTAQATAVRYSATPMFRVTYHQRKHLWKVAFALERRHENELQQAHLLAGAPAIPQARESELGGLLDEDDRDEASANAQVPNGTEVAQEDGATNPLEQITKQAKLIVKGDQFSEASLPYLIDALRVACDVKPRWNQTITDADVKRVARIRQLFQLSKERRVYEYVQADDRNGFMADLRDHAAGFLAPLIERIEVGWPSQVLASGVELVDLPGVGIAQDTYRDITKKYVRDKARAIILVVDRAGPTEATVDVLRSSGYWDRLVGAADDPASDPCTMLIAVTRVDDVAQTAWQNWDSGKGSRPKKREVFAQTVAEFKTRMRTQITEQLSKIGDSSNTSVQAAREQARKSILDGLEIHPVSAPELAKILRDDEEDQPVMLKEPKDTGVPDLQETLVRLGDSERARRAAQLQEVTDRLGSTVLNELQIVDTQWRSEGRAAEEAQRLEEALQKILKPKREEYDRRVGAFREFLDATVQAKIEALVQEAKAAAEIEVRNYLASLQYAHWGTLRAAVRRGGAFYGSRAINLPDDISNYFQEPMAAVWGQKLLRDVRKRTGELSSDIEQLVAEICAWANDNGGASINKKLLQTQQERVAALAEQMKQVGKEAVDELRNTVKSRLSEAIRGPVERACKKFVAEGDDIGPGVKSRILYLFAQLAEKATHAAQEPATTILQTNFAAVREEIQAAFRQGGDPVQGTADLIVEKHEERVKRSDAQKRRPLLEELERVLAICPVKREPEVAAA